jgi:predicted phosphodiesterase
MKAILSDIHGNLEALQAILADIDRHGVKAIYCLGDTVGYGPNPKECIDLAMRFRVALLGNHDHAALFNAEGFGAYAEQAIFWTRSQLERADDEPEMVRRRWAFLSDRQSLYQEDDVLFVHGSARNPLNEYVFPEDIYNERKMTAVFAAVPRYCFAGHTHVAGVFTEDFRFLSPEEIDFVYRLDGRKTLVNVGSVGQPRDGDWRACYILLDGTTVRFRRIEYDIETTVRKIRDIDDLDDWLGDRLKDGQ